MGFGKRNGGGPTPGQSPHRDQGSSWSQSPLLPQLNKIVGGVVIGVALLFAVTKLTRLFAGPMFTQNWETHPGDRSLASIRSDLGVDVQRLSSTCPIPSFGPTMTRRGKYPLTPQQQIILAEGEKVKSMANFITCTMSNQLQRFCQADARTMLREQVTTYLKMRRHSLRVAASQSGMSVEQIEATYARQMADNGGATYVERNRGLAPQPEHFDSIHALMRVDPDMLSTLKARIKDGLLSPADFSGFMGMFMPSELEPHIADINSDARPCK